VGSSLIGQDFTTQVGTDLEGGPILAPDPAYFQSRPSAAGAGYDPRASSASNLGPENPDLVSAVRERRTAAAALDGTDPADVAPDALLASGSGLDPHISPDYAEQQLARVARERGLTEEQVRQLVRDHTSDRTLGFLGEPHVNVLQLNLALDRLTGAADW
jgi:K+-transporting ATPase ATPase C chain